MKTRYHGYHDSVGVAIARTGRTQQADWNEVLAPAGCVSGQFTAPVAGRARMYLRRTFHVPGRDLIQRQREQGRMYQPALTSALAIRI